MAFFKLRFPGRHSANSGADALSNTPAESVEVIRKRARHRLMGSVVLVLGAVVGLPLLFVSQPRPVAIDTPIVIPDRNQATPLAAPVANLNAVASKERPVAVPAPAVQAPLPAAKNTVANVAALDPHEEVVTKGAKPDATPEVKADLKTVVKPEPKPEAKSEVKAESKKADVKSDVKSDAKDAAKAKALLDGKEALTYTTKAGDAEKQTLQLSVHSYEKQIVHGYFDDIRFETLP